MARRLIEQPARKGRVCSNCGIRIPLGYAHEYCRDCLKIKIFPAVRDYVRLNDVNELEVADHFGIDRELVHEWVTEGRLEYHE